MWRRILAFDIETYPDVHLIEAEGNSLASFREELKNKTGSAFLPPLYHIPIAIAFLWADLKSHEVSTQVLTGTLGQENFLIETFWRNCDDLIGRQEAVRGEGLLVSFNGNQFDIPVLELRSLKYGLRGNPLVREPAFHFDVPLFLANYKDSLKRSLRLSALSKLVGLPGKPMMDGSLVQSRFESGALDEIGRYCLLDVLQTYILFMRCQLLCGGSQDDYEESIRALALFFATSQDPSIRELSSYLSDSLRSVAHLGFAT